MALLTRLEFVGRTYKEDLSDITGTFISIVEYIKIGITGFIKVILPDPAFTIVVLINVDEVDCSTSKLSAPA